jgi:hypothetical protein
MNKQEALKRLESLESELKEIRLIICTPEKVDIQKEISEFLSEKFYGCTISKSKYGLLFSKEIDGRLEWLFKLDEKNKVFWIQYSFTWQILEKKYDLNYGELRVFAKCWLINTLNRKDLTIK